VLRAAGCGPGHVPRRAQDLRGGDGGAAAGAGGDEAFAGAGDDEFADELGEGGEDVEDEPAADAPVGASMA
jgi:hypothetical protein